MGDSNFESPMDDHQFWDPQSPWFVTWGRTSKAHAATISHDLGETPDQIFVDPAGGDKYLCNKYSAGATTFTVGLHRYGYGAETTSAATGTVTHGLACTPTAVLATPSLAGTCVAVFSFGATTFGYQIFDTLTKGSITGPFPYTFYWYAIGTQSTAKNIDWMCVRYA